MSNFPLKACWKIVFTTKIYKNPLCLNTGLLNCQLLLWGSRYQHEWGGHWKWKKQYFIFKFTSMKNMLRTFCIFNSQQHLQFGLMIQTVSPCYLWYMTNLSKQRDSGSFIMEAKGIRWDWSATSVQQAWIISVRREGLLCCEGEWDVRKFWGLSVRDKLRTQGWLIVLVGAAEGNCTWQLWHHHSLPGRSWLVTTCTQADLVPCQQLTSSSCLFFGFPPRYQ